jgi:hypothetical protein
VRISDLRRADQHEQTMAAKASEETAQRMRGPGVDARIRLIEAKK